MEGGGRRERPTLLGIEGLLIGIWCIATLFEFMSDMSETGIVTWGLGEGSYNHLAVLADPDALALDDLDVMEAAEDLVLDLEGGNHGELGALLDLERLV